MKNMKKICISIVIIMIALLFFGTVLAVEEKNILEKNTTSELIEIKDQTKTRIDRYTEEYGSESYGLVAYILNIVSKYSIPVCFIGIVVGALYQYVLGIRRLDMKQKGFGLIILFITILVICQVLPLIFAIVVKGWGD